jgi:Tol biopolymer transport system component/DNA-binding winged helix-turn-helix (wHTH) protein
LDPVAFRVLKAGLPVAVEPKAFEVLLFLVENPGRLVGKQELLDRIWPDTVVTESAMTRVIADLRRALGDSAHGARYIETVPTRGYRFIAGVRKAPDEAGVSPMPPDDEPVPTPRRLSPRFLWFGAGAVAIVAFFLGLGAMRREPTPAARLATSPHMRQVTDSMGLDLYPTFSPDGAEIAYSSDRGQGFEIFVRQLVAGGREIQITSDGQDNHQPAWSPNGREIAFASRERPGIRLVPALGGAPHRLTDFGSHPAWSPDGTTLVFQSMGIRDVWAGAAAAISPSSLFTVTSIGGPPLPLTRPGSPAGGHGAPSFSPDGKWISFATWGGDLSEIWRVSRDGRELDEVPGPGPGSRSAYFEPVFSPRGDWLYFASGGAGVDSSLKRSRVPARPGAAWGEPELISRAGTAPIRQPAISPDGTKLAYSAPLSTGGLWSLPLDAARGEPSGPPVPLTHTAGFRSYQPVFSPDGSHVAFACGRTGANPDIWVIDANGEHAEPLTNGSSASYLPNWFPDGKRIAFLSVQGGSMALTSVSLLDRREARILDLPLHPINLRLSPDGRLLALTADLNGVPNVWVMPVGDGSPRQVTFEKEGAGFTAWSPDGRLLAMSLVRGAENGPLAVVSAAGGDPRTLTEKAGESWPHDWSPDGERILFAGQREGHWDLYWISRQGGLEHRLTSYTSHHSFVRWPAWSPRGDQIVYEVAETTGNIWLMDLPR